MGSHPAMFLLSCPSDASHAHQEPAASGLGLHDPCMNPLSDPPSTSRTTAKEQPTRRLQSDLDDFNPGGQVDCPYKGEAFRTGNHRIHASEPITRQELGTLWAHPPVLNKKPRPLSKPEPIENKNGAHERTRTSTGLPLLEPESSASTNSATRALTTLRPGRENSMPD